MSNQTFNRIACCLVILGPIAMACSGGNTDPPIGPPTSNGGAAPAAGGNTSVGPATGGAPANGGSGTGVSSATGGTVVAMGGSGVGGAIATGGASPATGGRATGGAAPAVGGKAAGGAAPAAGGKAAGGAAPAAGGKAAGGAAGAWTSNGGKASGGTSAGGQATGGTPGVAGSATKSAGCGKAAPYTGQQTKTINISGTDRSYIVRLPDNYDSNNPYRLILSIHPLNGTAAGVASGSAGANYQFYGLWKLAAGSTIFVAPQGISNSWPGGNVPFLKALITDIENTLCVDTTRVFAEGFSMGGSMSYALACEIPEMLRGVAVHSGGPMSGCNKKNKPVPYFMTHGTGDTVCTYPEYGVPQIKEFAALNGCQAMDIPNTLKPTDSSGKTPVCADYQGCTAGYPTRACIFVGPHTPSPGGEATTWVPAETWRFISQF